MKGTRKPAQALHGHEVERAMWGPNPDPLRGFVEDGLWFLGAGFLNRFASAVLGQATTVVAKAEGPAKPPGWGEIMHLFEAGGPPGAQMASWGSLIDGFTQAILPTNTALQQAQVWALRTALLTQIQERVKAITTPWAWDRYFQIMPPAQKHIAAWTAQRGAQFVTKMTSAARQKTLDVLVDAELAHEGPRYIQTMLMERLGELNRDWRRIAITETAMAISNGQLASVADEGGWEAVWIGAPTACPFCRKMFGRTFEVVPKYRLGLDPEKFIWPGKHNVGRSAHLYRKDGTKRTAAELWWPCIPAHPNCACLWSLRRKITNLAGKRAEAILAGLRKERYERYSKV